MTTFTDVNVTGTVELSPGTPAAGATVTMTLSASIAGPDGTMLAPKALTARCDDVGAFSLTVQANDDPTTQPTGSFYKVVVTFGQLELARFNVIVSYLDAPSVDLFTLAEVSAVPPRFGTVTQLVAGEGIALDPGSGQGMVTVSATGSDAPVQSVFGRTGDVVAETGDYDVGQVTGAAPIDSPTFTGTVGLPTVIGTADFTLDTTGSTTSSPRTFGFTSPAAGEAWRVGQPGGAGQPQGVQGGRAVRMQVYSPGGIEFRGTTNAGQPPAYVPQNTATDPGVSVINTQPGVDALVIVGAGAQTGRLLSARTSSAEVAGITSAGTVFSSAAVLAANGGVGQVSIGAFGPSSQAAIQFGSTGTDRIWLDSAGVLATASSLLVGSTLRANAATFGQTTPASGASPVLNAVAQGAADKAFVARGASGQNAAIFEIQQSNTTGVFNINNNGTVRQAGGLAVGSITADLAGGQGAILAITNATTAPTSNPVGGGVVYVDGGALKYRGSAGTITTIAQP